MLAGDQLLRLYPRAWRERYGDEFLATVGHGALHLQQVIDIVAGAVDAWLSADVRRAARAGRVTPGEKESAMLSSLTACGSTKLRFTTRDSWLGAGAIIGATLMFSALGSAAVRAGYPLAGDILRSVAYPGSLAFALPFTFLKDQPWRARLVIVGVTLGLFVAAGYLASLT